MRGSSYTTVLTPREQQIVRCLLSAMSNREIADAVKINITTVRTHLVNIMNKKGMSTRLELALAAEQHPEWFEKYCTKCGRPL